MWVVVMGIAAISVAALGYGAGVLLLVRKDQEWILDDGPRPWDNDED